jgi:DNA-binding PadR family transcriptional regulator
MPDRRTAESFLPLANDALLILLAIASEPRHGYGIMRDVELRTEGKVVLQTGALYRTLKHLLRDGLVEETGAPRSETSTDERRRYYILTHLGHAVLAAEAERMSRLARAARAVAVGKRPRLA